MRLVKDPTKKYKATKCINCREDIYLFGCRDDGLGNKGLELQIHLDWKGMVLTPITVRKVNRP